MRKRDVVRIDDREITVKELTVQDVLEMFDFQEGDNFWTLAQRHLPKATDLSVEDMQKMAPSELETVFEKWKEVNASFFRIARALGLNSVLAQMKDAVVADFYNSFFGSLKTGTHTPGATDGPPSA